MLLSAPLLWGEELPLPPDVKAMPKPYELVMGSQPVRAVGLRTKLSVEQARGFYEKALAKRGWRILEVPWFAESEKQREALRQAVAAHPEHVDDPKVTAVLSDDNVQRVRAAAGQQLYAVNGSDHVLVGFTQSGNATLLTLARWTGPEEKNPLAAPASGQPVEPPPAWPAANPCCGGAGVSETLRQLPATIPAYPNGRMITAGTRPVGTGKRAVMAEMYMTADSTDQVVDYYRHQMAYNGWTEAEGVSQSSSAEMAQLLGQRAGQFKWTSLTFQGDRGMCSVVVTESRPQEGAGSAASPLAMLIPGGASGASGTTEQTLISVNYLETPALSRHPPRGSKP